MKKLVIAGSASLQEKVLLWKKYWEGQGYFVLDYPDAIPKDEFMKLYPGVYTDFFKHITEADVLFVMNEDKNGVEGYIGAESFAEMCFAVANNQLYQKNVEIVLLKMPSRQVQAFDEVELWLKLGWIKLHNS